MTSTPKRPRTILELEARALPMILTPPEPGEGAAAALDVPYARLVEGRLTVIPPRAEA